MRLWPPLSGSVFLRQILLWGYNWGVIHGNGGGWGGGLLKVNSNPARWKGPVIFLKQISDGGWPLPPMLLSGEGGGESSRRGLWHPSRDPVILGSSGRSFMVTKETLSTCVWEAYVTLKLKKAGNLIHRRVEKNKQAGRMSAVWFQVKNVLPLWLILTSNPWVKGQVPDICVGVILVCAKFPSEVPRSPRATFSWDVQRRDESLNPRWAEALICHSAQKKIYFFPGFTNVGFV